MGGQAPPFSFREALMTGHADGAVLQYLEPRPTTMRQITLCPAILALHLAAQLPSPDNWYQIKAWHSEKCVSVPNNGQEDGASLIQWDCVGEDGQAYRFTPVRNGLFKIEVRGRHDMVVTAVLRDWGYDLVQSTWTDRDAQLFSVTPSTGGSLIIASALIDKVWDVADRSSDNGANVQLWESLDATNQRFSLDMAAPSSPLRYENLGPAVNSEIAEVAPMMGVDGRTLYYSRGTPGDIISDGNIMVARMGEDGKWERARRLGGPLETKWHNSVMGILPGDNGMLLWGDHSGGSSLFSFTSRTADGWSVPQPVAFESLDNTGHVWHGNLGADGNTIIMQLYTSKGRDDRDSDILVSFRKEDGGWTTPKPVGPPVNSYHAEHTPYLAGDMRTLYFSSDRPGGKGGQDVYMSKRLDDTWTNWSEPVNLGDTVNSGGWEMYYTIPADGEWAYFSSHSGSIGDADILRVRLKESVRPDPFVVVEGRTLDQKSGGPMGAVIHYEVLGGDGAGGQVASDPATGQYQIALPKGHLYGFYADADGYIPVTENMDLTTLDAFSTLTRDLHLVPIEAGQVVRLNNIFFDTGKADLREASFAELDRLAGLMKARPGMSVELAGHTDDVGGDAENLQLSSDRAASVRAYLLSKGVGERALVAKGYGETAPVAGNDSEAGRQLNRRVELRIIAG